MPRHIPISPAILYWGTPVILISSTNDDGTTNIAPMSSAWWLGTDCFLGLDSSSCTTANILGTGECVLNLPSDNMTKEVNAIARTTGSDTVPPSKLNRGYVTLKDKWMASGLTPLPSQIVKPPGIQECPVVMEAKVVAVHDTLSQLGIQGAPKAIEVSIEKVSVHENLKKAGYENRIDCDAWKPMIMMFCELYGLRPGKVAWSRLAEIDEELYRGLMVKEATPGGKMTSTTEKHTKGEEKPEGVYKA